MEYHEPLEAGGLYHIYNRSVDDVALFPHAEQYRYFLRLYARHSAPVIRTYAYALLPNHFHLLVQVRPGVEDAHRPLANCFNAYAQARNRRYGRRGAVFAHRFHRKAVTTPAYAATLVRYLHENPQRHGLVADFRLWPFTSWQACVSPDPTRLARKSVLALFDGADGFTAAHTRLLPNGAQILIELGI